MGESPLKPIPVSYTHLDVYKRKDLAKQILKRDYNWKIGTREAIIEHLEHRLFFPQEIAGLLSANGFEVVELFDKPEPHISSFTDIRPFQFGYELSGRRLQVIAKAI